MATAASAVLGLDFAQLIRERTEQFTGRAWVFDALGAWLSKDDGPPVFLLTGGPGTGKSAIAARLAQMNLGQVPGSHSTLGRGSLTYAHFCQGGVENTLSPITFVQSLSQSLANRYPLFRQALERAGSRQIVINVNQIFDTVQAGTTVVGANIGQINITIKGGDARSVFDDAVSRPLRELAGGMGAGERIAILVDSLDEAVWFSADNNIAQLLGVASDFPASVRFILTCRSNSQRVFDIVGPSTLDLIVNAPPNLDEVIPYVAARLQGVREPDRSVAASRVAAKSEGNFLYAYHVVEDLLARGGVIVDADTLDLPATLEGVYRKSLDRGLGSSRARWNDAYRPILGAIAVARGDGLAKTQLVEITGLAEDTASDVLDVAAQFLVGGGNGLPYRIYHQSFREFLLDDETFTVFPAERHAAIARYLQERCSASWNRCTDDYALRYTPAHWADAASLSPVKREVRTQALIDLVADPRYQQRFEQRIADLPMLHAHVHRAVQVAALNERDEMLRSLVRSARAFVAFRREYLRADSVVSLADSGRLALAEARLPLFTDVSRDWQAAARLILAWLSAERNPAAATQLRDSIAQTPSAFEPIVLLLARLTAALNGVQEVPADKGVAPPLELGHQLVKRISGQAFDRELLMAINPSIIVPSSSNPEMLTTQGFASTFDAPMLVNLARETGVEGTLLVDEYIDAHAGYNYVEYRNKSLWYVLLAVLRHHPDQQWVKARLRRLVVAALSGGGVDFEEMLPLTAAMALDRARGGGTAVLDAFEQRALLAADVLQQRRGANDSWGSHRRRLTALMELSHLLLKDAPRSARLFQRITTLPDGFAGFQAPALLRAADALRACRMESRALDQTLDRALVSAHHIQDYHFCARITARCNALMRWHRLALAGTDLAAAIERLARSPNDVEFAADHVIGESYAYRPKTPDMLPVTPATRAATLEQLVDIFQRSSVEFRRLNPLHGVTEALETGTLIHIPDPGFAPLLAVHLAARALAEDAIADDRVPLVRSLAPIAAINPTALDTILSYLIVAADLRDTDLLEEIAKEAGPLIFTDASVPLAQIGPDAVLPT